MLTHEKYKNTIFIINDPKTIGESPSNKFSSDSTNSVKILTFTTNIYILKAHIILQEYNCLNT
jgi:hypothetical protein